MTARVHVERRLADYPPPTPQPTPCRLWQGSCSPKGYGRKWVAGRGQVDMHVWIWEQVNGPVPTGMMVCHRCDNPPCYRLDHLFLGTSRDNRVDAVQKGRAHLAQPGEGNPSAKLTEADVTAIRASDEKSRVLADRYGVSRDHISRIRRGGRWNQSLRGRYFPMPESQASND